MDDNQMTSQNETPKSEGNKPFSSNILGQQDNRNQEFNSDVISRKI